MIWKEVDINGGGSIDVGGVFRILWMVPVYSICSVGLIL